MGLSSILGLDVRDLFLLLENKVGKKFYVPLVQGLGTSRIVKLEVVVPANTVEAEFKSDTVEFQKGNILHIWLIVPDGCHGFARVRFRKGINVVIPDHPVNGWLTNLNNFGDDILQGGTITIETKSVPFTLESYSAGALWEHKITAIINWRETPNV